MSVTCGDRCSFFNAQYLEELIEYSSSILAVEPKEQAIVATHLGLLELQEFLSCSTDEKYNFVELFSTSAQRGYPLGRFLFGIVVLEGLATKPDPLVGTSFISMAALNNCPFAINCMGVFLQGGYHLLCDLAQSRKYFEKAAKLRDPRGMRNAGMLCLQSGSIDEQKQGLRFLCSAAKAGDVAAMQMVEDLRRQLEQRKLNSSMDKFSLTPMHDVSSKVPVIMSSQPESNESAQEGSWWPKLRF